jgi:hypothetical protein
MKLNFIGLLALVAVPMAHAGVDTCDMQKPCVDWTMSKLDSSNCGLGDCTVEVCMIVDESLDSCTKSGTFSHMCDQTDSDGCALWSDTDPLVPVMSGSGSTADCANTGETNSTQLSGKCEGFSSIKMCQEGVPGQTLYWILKDGSDSTIETEKPYSFTYDNESGCDAEVSCVSNLKQCGGGDTQQLMERTWMFKIPDTTGSCDICGSVDPPVDTPVDPIPGGTTSGSLGDPHCK